jgi:hypothetical protein
MTFKTRLPNVLRRGVRAAEDLDFSAVFRTADEDEGELVFLRSPSYDPATLTEVSDVLDGDGNFAFDLTYYLDMEKAARANIRRVRFDVYVKNPKPATPSPVPGRPGTRTHTNSRVRDALGARGRGIKGTGLGAAATLLRSTAEEATCRNDRSNTRELDRGLVRTFEVRTGINDPTVTTYRDALRRVSSAVRLPAGATPASLSSQAVSTTFAASSQVYSVAATPIVKISSNTVGPCEQTVRGLVGDRPNTADPRLGRSEAFQETTQRLAQQVLLSGRDPTAHLNMFYSTGPSASGGSPREPIRYDGYGTVQNEVQVSRSGRAADNRFQPTRPAGTQALTTQRAPKFSSSAQEALYRKSASIPLRALDGAQFLGTPIRQLNFRSSLRQFRAEFDVPIPSLRPRINKSLWVVASLIGRDGRVSRSRTFRVDVRKQLKSHLTPALPPSLRVLSQSEGRASLELEQRDPLATDITLYRMVARPDELAEATWTRVTDLRMNSRRGSVKFVDDTVAANVQPNLVLYEARCSGLFGSICPVTTRVVEAGVKRIANLTRSKRQGVCNIVATQVGNRIEVRVSRIPTGVTRVFLKKQLINSALRERDFRKLLTVRAQSFGPDSPSEYYDTAGSSGTYVFEDNDVVNRQFYRYFAQFDWLDRERTNSVTEEFIEFRRVPERPIVSYLENPTEGVDSLGRPFVSFELGANFADAGLEELNRILGDTGVSNLFVDELRKDRSLISNLLLFQVTRRNTSTGETVVWPLVQEGLFTDSEETRAAARGTTGEGVDASLRPGAQYLYTARLNIVNPERFFKQALTRIPASTRQIITDTDPNFVLVSAAKFAENFAIQPGTIQSPTTLEREVKFSEQVQGSYTGISYDAIIDIPLRPAFPRLVRAVRSARGRPANVVKWEVEGSLDRAHTFEVSITLDRDRTFPLMGVSPTVSEDGKYEIRDELYAREIVPVSYSVAVIYSDMSRSAPVKSNEIYAGSTLPVSILDLAIKKQVTTVPGLDLSLIKPGSLEAIQLAAGLDPWVAGPLADPSSGARLAEQTASNRNSSLSSERLENLKNKNPVRKRRGF